MSLFADTSACVDAEANILNTAYIATLKMAMS